jgi:energy-coupling factor transport system permease protein
MIQSLVLNASFANAATMILGITLFYTLHILPIYMLFCWMVETTTISEWMKSMERSHMPKGFIITTATLLRYVPTISYEFSYIKNTMKMRGIGLDVFNFFRKPVKMMQYSLAPLLLRSVKIADDLSASAMTRGIEYEVRRSSYYDVTSVQNRNRFYHTNSC